MGYIKEPKGVDFFIKSDPLDDKARKEISEYIKAYKAKHGTEKETAVTPKAGRITTSVKKGVKGRSKVAK